MYLVRAILNDEFIVFLIDFASVLQYGRLFGWIFEWLSFFLKYLCCLLTQLRNENEYEYYFIRNTGYYRINFIFNR